MVNNNTNELNTQIDDCMEWFVFQNIIVVACIYPGVVYLQERLWSTRAICVFLPIRRVNIV